MGRSPPSVVTISSLRPPALITMAVANELAVRDGIVDVEDQKGAKPDYLDESIINVRVCCPSLMFKLCPCFLFSCFSGVCMGVFSCVCGCCKSICNCILGCCLSVRKCIFGCCMGLRDCLKAICVTCCSPFKKCIECCIKCFSKICSPCISCGRCICDCLLSCLQAFNCCNFSCGLPCRNPPGCVCIFPCKACGLGLTCPYACCSCGWKHCIKMPAEEQQYWHKQKANPKQLKMDLHQKVEQSKAAGAAEESDALRKEIESLRQQLKEIGAEAGKPDTKLAETETPMVDI